MSTPTVDRYQGPAEIWVNGRAQYEAQSISWSAKGNNNKVLTLRKGLAGKADGPRETEITIKSAVPIKGLEFNWIRFVQEGKTCSIVFKIGGTRFQCAGWIDSSDGDSATDSPTSISGVFMGGPMQIIGG